MMKVRELIKLLENENPEAFVEIKTDQRWTEDVKEVRTHENEDAEVVVITSVSY